MRTIIKKRKQITQIQLYVLYSSGININRRDSVHLKLIFDIEIVTRVHVHHCVTLQNLDALHDHLGTLYPGMRAPSFRCTERPEDGALVLHYYSDRPGLEHIVIGIVKVAR